eukprot:1194375-Prorocentrum_minimum.AAC.6
MYLNLSRKTYMRTKPRVPLNRARRRHTCPRKVCNRAAALPGGHFAIAIIFPLLPIPTKLKRNFVKCSNGNALLSALVLKPGNLFKNLKPKEVLRNDQKPKAYRKT